MVKMADELTVTLPIPHLEQERILTSTAKRKIIRAGRRSGKTVGAAIMAVEAFLEGKRVLYTAPTTEQVDTFWYEVKQALAEPIVAGVFTKNETEHTIEKKNTENRIQGHTAWSADMIRGSYADLLIMDEFQLCNEDLWEIVGAPMLLDNNGDAIFFYTPPSLRSVGVSKARDPRHAAKLFKQAKEDTTGRWQVFSFTSHDNPHIDRSALEELIKDMSRGAYRQEILAEDDEAQLSWMVYKAFREDTCKIERFPIPQGWPRFVGHDFGASNPAALFIAQDPATGYFYVYHEYLPGGGRSTAQHVEEFKRITAGTNVIKRVGGSHQEGEVRAAYTAHGWPIQEPKFRLVSAQVDRVVGLMELNKIFIFNDLVHYLEELMNCMWVLDNQQKPTDKIKNEQQFHVCACARYLFSDFTPETVRPGKAARVVYY